MKILIATGLYPPDIGGPATYTKMLEAHLPKHGVQLTVAPYGWVRRYPKLFRHIAYTWKLIRESSDCDAIYALDPVSVGLPTYIAHMITRKPYLLRIAGDYAWEQGQQRFGVTQLLDEFVRSDTKHPVFVRILRWVQRRVARSARHIVVPSNYMKTIVTAWGVGEDEITSIYSALHKIEVEETKDAIRTMFDYRGTVLVTAARLVPWKGIGTLISILTTLKEAIGDVTLVIIGDGPLKHDLEQRVLSSGLKDVVRFVGSLPQSSLGAAIKGADIFVLNTAYEGMSHQILEAMDLGVPVVTTKVGGNIELITSGVNGLLVSYDNRDELASAIERMTTHEEFREYGH